MKIIDSRSATDLRADARKRRRAQVLRAGPLAGAIVAAVLIAGCGGSSSGGGGVAHIKSSTSAAKSGTKSSAKPSALAYSQCMRKNGVSNFPDPNSSGDIQISPSDGVNPNSSTYQTAATDCKSLGPAGAVSASQSTKAMAVALKFATCMQKNGVPNYPDPTSSNGAIDLSLPSDVNPNSPAYERAQKKCGSPIPGGKAVPAP